MALGQRSFFDLANQLGRDIDTGLEMRRGNDKRDLIEMVAAKHEISAEVIESLLDLENDFRNLHAYGARPQFRSRIEEIIDAALERTRMDSDG